MEALTQAQIDEYQEVGAIVVPDQLGPVDLAEIRAVVDRFYDLAREMTASDDRIDLEDSHRPGDPRIRRIKRPDRQADVFRRLMLSDAILAPVRDLIGPDLRLHTSKLNMKSAGFGAAVEWHQDWAFYPHTNDNVLAVGVMLDDMAEENGPLMIFPGSHKGPIFDHHSKGVFIGAMHLGACGFDIRDAVTLTGSAGSISIHHARVVHGSALNRSERDRRLLFYEMMAADAFPIMGGLTTFASIADYNALMLCGQPTLEPRVDPVPVRIPQPQPGEYGSIYEIQKALGNRGFEIYKGEDV